MDDPVDQESRQIRKEAAQIKRSTKTFERRTSEMSDSAARRTILAGDRTLLAAERTYAAWVRTALAALVAGVGSTALVREVLPKLIGRLTGTVLVLFAGFCLVAAVWRELQGYPPRPHPDIRPIPRALLVPMNLSLLLVAVVALVGVWSI